MDTLIRELEMLRDRPDLPNTRILGAVIATAVRFREILDKRMVGIQALATAVAMQPQVDASKLHDDFLQILRSHYESDREIPCELRDIAAAITLAAAERH